MPVAVVTTIAEVRSAVLAARRAGKTVGFVPTMGALHEGHAALVRAAAATSSFVVVSVFVNPTQFGPKEDFAKYPRTLEADQKLCDEAGAHLIFAPSAAEMYPGFGEGEKGRHGEGEKGRHGEGEKGRHGEGEKGRHGERENDKTNERVFSPLLPSSPSPPLPMVTFVEVKELDAELDGPARPGHFRGVCTVVLKLFNIVQPDVSHFGAKDGQQARIIRQMVRDLNVPVEVRVEPTVREADGLAMSSRNRYLSPTERATAPAIYKALQHVKARALAGEIDVAHLESALHSELSAIPGSRVDYARVLDADMLQPLPRLDRPVIAAVAVFIGTTRLIDNITLNGNDE